MYRTAFPASAFVVFVLVVSADAANIYDNLRFVIIPELEVLPSESNRLFAQHFLMGENDRIDDVTVRLFRIGEPSGSLTLELWNDSEPGSPEVKLGEFGSVTDVAQIGTDAMDITFEASIGDLTRLEEYWVVLTFADAAVAIDNSIAWSAFSTAAGTNGADNALVSIDNGVSWINSPVSYFAMSVNASLTGDFDGNGTLDSEDIDELTRQSASLLHDPVYDLNEDSFVDSVDVDAWIKDLVNSWIGDANLDGEFNSTDLVALFAAGDYEDGLPMNSTWSTGDFDGDGDFGSGDLIAAFTDGGYELGNAR